MTWFDDIISRLPQAEIQIVNDSKTPSGRAHVGSLRGVLIHDAAFKVLKSRGINIRYTFGVDDYDPLDEIPFGLTDFYEPYLGKPLCNVPAPPGSTEPDIAKHYIKEFFDVFDEMHVEAERYYLRDIYRSGEFNEAIDNILKHVDKVRDIYLKVSNSIRSKNWHPFQVVCENCGRIGTTEVLAYENGEVVYECRPDLVTWARGCGHKGKMSPFNGNGKLPWKLEWTAKWAYRGVTIEGAGTDHNTRGGSRDVASTCLKEIFGKRPPVNIPYGFFTMGGAKMSSSRGIGATARDMADFLPPEMLRFLLLNAQPKTQVNFEPNEKYVTKLFNDFDKLHTRYWTTSELNESDRLVYELSQVVHPKEHFYVTDFNLITTLLQLPHIDLKKEVEKRKGSPLPATDEAVLNRRIVSARYWIDNYASEEEKVVLQETLPARAEELTVVQKAFLLNLCNILPHVEWRDDILQATVFDAARITPIDQKSCFQAFYRVLLDKEQGPKAGNLIACLDKSFLMKRLQEPHFDRVALYRQANIGRTDLENWLKAELENIVKVDIHVDFICRNGSGHSYSGAGVVELSIKLKDNKTHMKRLLLSDFDGIAESQAELDHFKEQARLFLEEINAAFPLELNISSALFDIRLD
ncbi:MAG: lysine--tRNA ligase [Bacteroidetes bacterium]|nr:lysine--tRNA ligase [Bacteroidota bacterium]